jgi:hypothetical protein
MVAARTRSVDGTEQLELTTRVTLSSDSNTALAQGINLPLVVNEAIRVCLVEVDVMMRTRAQLGRPTAGELDGSGRDPRCTSLPVRQCTTSQ